MAESAIETATVCLRFVPESSNLSQCLSVVLSAPALMPVDALLECIAARSGDFQLWRKQRPEHTYSLGCYRRPRPSFGESDRLLRASCLDAARCDPDENGRDD